MIEQIGAFAGLAAFLGLAVLALLAFAQGRDIRRLREWAGSAPERDAERKEATSAMAAARAEELRQLQEARTAERALGDREERRRRREEGLPEASAAARFRAWLYDARYLIAVVAVFVLVVGGAAFVLLGGSDEGRQGGGKGGGAKAAQRMQPPSEVEVTVLNGTAVAGLAATFGDQVENEGFRLGAVTNSPSSFAESVAMFTRGNAPEARQVARRLGIDQVRLMTPDIEALAGGAPVAVIVGEDNAETTG